MERRDGGRRSFSKGGTAGFTLIELVVSLAVVLLVFLLAGQLLLEAARLSSFATRRALDPLPEVARAALVADLRTARPPPASPGLWNRAPLELDLGDGRRVVWGEEGGRLVARESGPGGSGGPRAYLDGVVRWRWRLLAGGLVEVDVEIRRTLGPFLQRMTAPLTRLPSGERSERLDVVVLPRGGGSVGW